MKAIKIKDSTYDYIMSQGEFRETLDDIIVRLIGSKRKTTKDKEVHA